MKAALECLADIEDYAVASLGETPVDSHVHTRLELPTQAEAVCGQGLAHVDIVEVVEDVDGSHPGNDTETPYRRWRSSSWVSITLLSRYWPKKYPRPMP